MTLMSCRLKVESCRFSPSATQWTKSGPDASGGAPQDASRLRRSRKYPPVLCRLSTFNLQPSTFNCSGFTLIELLVVCLLIAILAALIIPEMRGSFEDAVLRSSGRKLIDVLNVTYSRSVSLNQLHRLHFDKYTGRYIVEKQVGDGQEDSDFEPATELAGFSGQIDPRISIDIQKSQVIQTDDSDTDSDDQSDTPSDTISFYADGTADARDILLRDRMGFQLALQVNPNTARVSVVEANSKLE